MTPRMTTVNVTHQALGLAEANFGDLPDGRPYDDRASVAIALVGSAKLLLIEIVFFQEFGPEILWRHGDVWPPLWRKVHEIPVRPNCVDMIPR